MKPIIGVLARPYMTDNGRYVMSILENIRKAVIKSGGIPLMILPTQNMNYLNNKETILTDEDKEILNSQIDLCDGILMPGGDRIYFYDKYVCSIANRRHLPLFGICMGMQVMCNYNNENINEKIEGHKEPQGSYIHDVTIDKSSKLYNNLYGQGNLISVPDIEYEFSREYAHILITGQSMEPHTVQKEICQ